MGSLSGQAEDIDYAQQNSQAPLPLPRIPLTHLLYLPIPACYNSELGKDSQTLGWQSLKTK